MSQYNFSTTMIKKKGVLMLQILQKDLSFRKGIMTNCEQMKYGMCRGRE
jgi:hypothetical protein